MFKQNLVFVYLLNHLYSYSYLAEYFQSLFSPALLPSISDNVCIIQIVRVDCSYIIPYCLSLL